MLRVRQLHVRALAALALLGGGAAWVVTGSSAARADDCSWTDLTAAINAIADPIARADLLNTLSAIQSAQSPVNCDEYETQTGYLFQQLMMYQDSSTITDAEEAAAWDELAAAMNCFQTCDVLASQSGGHSQKCIKTHSWNGPDFGHCDIGTKYCIQTTEGTKTYCR